MRFDEWFQRATGNYPFPYQRRFAEEVEIPQLVDVPTGLGKTDDWERKDECPLFPLQMSSVSGPTLEFHREVPRNGSHNPNRAD